MCRDLKGAFTPDTNEALRTNDLHVKSMQRRDRQSCGAIRANEVARMTRFARITWRELSIWGVWRVIRELKNQKNGGYSCCVNQSGACSSSDVITNSHFATRLELPGRSRSHDANSRLLCSEFHARMNRVNSKCSSIQ